MTQEPTGASPAPEWFRQRLQQQEEAGPTRPADSESKMRDEMQLRATASTSAIHGAIRRQKDTEAADQTLTYWERIAKKTFGEIDRLKHEFFESVFNDAPWMEFTEYADESRRFSTFVKLVFGRLRNETFFSKLPSSTEVNSWYWLFKRRQQFADADVPEAALPQTRKVQEALQSVTKDCRSDQEKVERQIDILQRCSELIDETETDSVSTSMVNSVAEELEIKPASKPKIPNDFEPRLFSDMTQSEWLRLMSLGLKFRDALLEPKADYRQRERLLSMSRTFVDLCSHQTTFVLAVFDENDLFQGCVARLMAQKGCLMDRPAQKKKSFFRVHAETDINVIHGDELISAVLPMADRPDELVKYHRLVGCRGNRKLPQLIKVNTGRINPKWRIEELDLAVLQLWFSNGNIPVGTYVDEVIEPDFTAPEEGDGSSVL